MSKLQSIQIRCLFLISFFFSLVALQAVAPAGGLEVKESLMPRPLPRGWASENGTYRPSPTNHWNFLPVGNDVASNQFIQAHIELQATGVIVGGFGFRRSGGQVNLGGDLPGENDRTFDAGLVLRYKATPAGAQFYRVAVTLEPGLQTLSVWKTGGGFLVLKKLPESTPKSVQLRAEVVDEAIIIYLNGEEVARYVDTNPLQGGVPGLAALRSTVDFSNVVVGDASHGMPRGEKATRDFAIRSLNDLYPGQWLFHGDEPLFLFETKIPEDVAPGRRGNFGMRWVKLKPGTLPAVAYNPIQITQHRGSEHDIDAARELRTYIDKGIAHAEWKLTGGPEESSTAITKMQVTYDEAKDRYVYEFETQVNIGEHGLPYASYIEFFDPWAACSMGLVTNGYLPEQRFRYILLEQPHGLPTRVLPLTRDYQEIGSQCYMERKAYRMLHGEKQGNREAAVGGASGFVGETDVNVITRIRKTSGLNPSIDLCAWGHDLHYRLTLPPGTTRIEPGIEWNIDWTMTHEDHAVVDPLIQSALSMVDFIVRDVRPIFGYPTTNFTKGVDTKEPRNQNMWAGGTFIEGEKKGAGKFTLLPGQSTGVFYGTGHQYPEDMFRIGKHKLRLFAMGEGAGGKVKIQLKVENPFVREEEFVLAVAPAEGKVAQPLELVSSLPSRMILGSLTITNTGDVPVELKSLEFEYMGPHVEPGNTLYEVENFHPPKAMVADEQAANGFALHLGPEGDDCAEFSFGPYCATLLPGDYEAKLRIRAKGNVATSQIDWSASNTEAPPEVGSPARGTWEGYDFSPDDSYVEKTFLFHRSPAGRLNFSFRYKGNKEGSFLLDSITVRRLRDERGRPL